MHPHRLLPINPIITISKLDISTDSANILAHAFQPLLENPVYLFIALFSMIASIAAAIAAYKSYQIGYNALKNNVLQMFFTISTSLPTGTGATLTLHHKQLICNYFDYVCKLLLDKELKNKDVDILSSVMKEAQFVSYADNYRKKFGDDYFKYYWEWLNS